MTLSAKLSSLAALVLDIDNYPKWSFNTEKSYVLKKISPSELYFYTLINSPWPVSDRDLAVHLSLVQDSNTHVLTLSAIREIANFIPEKKGIVRVPLSIERWTVYTLTLVERSASGTNYNSTPELRPLPGLSITSLSKDPLRNVLPSPGANPEKERYRECSHPFYPGLNCNRA